MKINSGKKNLRADRFYKDEISRKKAIAIMKLEQDAVKTGRTKKFSKVKLHIILKQPKNGGFLSSEQKE